MNHTKEDKPDVEAGELQDQSIQNDDEVDGGPHELDDDESKTSHPCISEGAMCCICT